MSSVISQSPGQAEAAGGLNFEYDSFSIDTLEPSLDGLSYRVLGLTLDMLNAKGHKWLDDFAFQAEKQHSGEYSGTFLHSLEVGALVFRLTGMEDAAVYGALHDSGKSHDEVRPLIGLNRMLTPEEWAVMDRHGPFGAACIEGKIDGPEELRFAQAVAAGHGMPPQMGVATAWERHAEELTGITRIADRAQAILLDWEGRPYKAARMTAEGILVDGKLDIDKAIEAIVGDERTAAYLRVPTTEVVELARHYMPEPEWIQEQVLLYSTN